MPIKNKFCLAIIVGLVTSVNFVHAGNETSAVTSVDTNVMIQMVKDYAADLAANPALSGEDVSKKYAALIDSYHQGKMDKGVATLEALLLKDSQSQDFYGKLIDQYGQPIAGVDATAQIVRAFECKPEERKMFHIPTNDVYKTQSDASGLFHFVGLRGWKLDITVGKKGYILSSKNPHGFGGSGLSLDQPVIFKMWKPGEPQQLVSHGLSRIGIPVDGQPVQFDLFNGKKVASGGQLIVRLKRDPQILPPRNPRYDWSLELEIPNGGLVANSDEFMYQASENGYQESYKFDMPKDTTNWTTALNQQFYIQLENRKHFGSLVVRLSTIHDTPPLGLNLDIVINSNDSRSLQP
jgi:hypothetical protein